MDGDGTGWSAADINALLVANGSGFGPGSALEIDTTNGDFPYNYSISGSIGLTCSGTNVLTLSGSNSYSGGTTVLSGTLELTNSSACPARAF